MCMSLTWISDQPYSRFLQSTSLQPMHSLLNFYFPLAPLHQLNTSAFTTVL